MQIIKNNITFEATSSRYNSFWESVNQGKWEEGTFQIFSKFLNKEHSYIDIGSWIGPTVLYGSALSKNTYAIEPDPVAYNELKHNIELNNYNNIILSNYAISNYDGDTQLGIKGEEGNSLSSIVIDCNKNIPVKCIKLESFFKQNEITDCNFIKMDCEGGETVILDCDSDFFASFKPIFYISVHTPFFKSKDDIEKIIKFLKIYDNIYCDSDKILPEDLKSISKPFYNILAIK